MVADKVRGIYDEEAKERQKRKPKSEVENLPQQKETPKARDKAAGTVGQKLVARCDATSITWFY